MWQKYVNGCGCCPDENCLLASDDFNRSDSDDLGADWTEEAGDGDIVSNQLSISDADSLIIHDAVYPNVGSPGSYRHPGGLEVTVASATTGAQARLVGGFLDTDNYAYAEWEFGATDATLRLGTVVAGSDSGGVEFIVPGRGAGVSTRLFFCWRLDGLLVSSDDFSGPLVANNSPLPLAIGGDRAGVGTGGTTGGAVTFDDYEAYKTTATPCPGCATCGHCGDSQKICIFVSGLTDIPPGVEFDFSVFNGSNILSRSPGGGPGITPACGWWKENDDYFWRSFLFYDDPDWILQADFTISRVSGGLRQAVATFQANLGPSLPDCATWQCIQLSFVSCTYPDFDMDCSEWTEEAIVLITSGDTCPDEDYCYYYGPNGCCASVAIPLLYVTATVNGSPLYTDEPLDEGEGQSGGGFEFSANSNDIVFFCRENFPAGHPDKVGIIVEGATSLNNVTIVSCEPFLATVTAEISGDVYDIIISE